MICSRYTLHSVNLNGHALLQWFNLDIQKPRTHCVLGQNPYLSQEPSRASSKWRFTHKVNQASNFYEKFNFKFQILAKFCLSSTPLKLASKTVVSIVRRQNYLCASPFTVQRLTAWKVKYQIIYMDPGFEVPFDF